MSGASSAPPAEVAVFGGSFDPPHLGHVLAGAYVRAMHPSAKLLVVPAHDHPFEKLLSPFADRVSMCRLAMAGVAGAEVSEVGAEVPAPGRTLDLLEHLLRREPGLRLRLVIGSDLCAETPRWHRYDEVARLAPPIIVPRGGYAAAGQAGGLPVIPAISSSEVRERVRTGASLQGLLPHAVGEYIAAHGLYRAADG